MRVRTKFYQSQLNTGNGVGGGVGGRAEDVWRGGNPRWSREIKKRKVGEGGVRRAGSKNAEKERRLILTKKRMEFLRRNFLNRIKNGALRRTCSLI